MVGSFRYVLTRSEPRFRYVQAVRVELACGTRFVLNTEVVKRVLTSAGLYKRAVLLIVEGKLATVFSFGLRELVV